VIGEVDDIIKPEEVHEELVDWYQETFGILK